MSVFAVGDIHGEREKLDALLAALPRTDADTTVFLGDAIDRGADSAGVVRRLLLEFDQAPDRTILLWGNHEDMAASHFGHASAPRCYDYDRADWFRNGGFATLESFGESAPHITTDCPPELTRYFSLLQLFWRGPAGLICVHAGLPPLSEPEETAARTLLWSREYLFVAQPDTRLVVHGHTPKMTPDIGTNRIGIDTGAYRGGSLTALQLPERVFYEADESGTVTVVPLGSYSR